jgi:alkylated DNA nucleotide flippase Atl1
MEGNSLQAEVLACRSKGLICLSRKVSDRIQAELLRAEGIAVAGNARLPLGRYLWVPPLEPAVDG